MIGPRRLSVARPLVHRFAVVSAAALVLLLPRDVLAREVDRSAGIFVFAGYGSYAMQDLNKALRDYSLLDPTFTGHGEEISGGLSAGGGVRARVSNRVSLSAEAAWMDAKSKGATTIDGLDYAVLLDVPALSFSLDGTYSVPLNALFSIGATGGVGYYLTTGQLKLTRDFLQIHSDLDAQALGVHGALLGEMKMSQSLTAKLTFGYRHARASSLRVDNVELRNQAGERIAPDWSGVDARLAIEAHFGH